MNSNPANSQMKTRHSKKSLFIGCLILLFTAACNQAPQPQNSVQAQSNVSLNSVASSNVSSTKDQNKSNQLVLNRKKVLDPAKSNMVSQTIYVPEGWKISGQTRWPHPRFFQLLPSPQVEVSSPDGFKVTIHHTASFSDPRPTAEYQSYGIRRPAEDTSDGGSLVRYRPDSNREWKAIFKDKMIPVDHPTAKNIRVNKVSEVKELSQMLRQKARVLIEQVNQTNRLARSYGLPENQSIEIKGLMIEATFEKDGKPYEYVALLGFYNTETKMQGMTQVRWSVEPSVAYSGPKGKLESKLPILSAITGSMRPTPSWTREVQNYVRSITPRSAPSSSSTSTSVANTYSEILDISHNGYRARSGMSDAGQSKYVRSVHETSNYSYGGTSYSLPAGYDHVYTNDFDTIILTNDSLFNPNVDLNANNSWTRMNQR